MPDAVANRKTGSRTRARRLAMQAVYQWFLNQTQSAYLENQYLDDLEGQSANREYFSELLQGVLNHHDELVKLVSPYLDRPVGGVDPVERAILLLATFEFKYVLSVPYRVVINEAVELARSYGAEQGHKFVNGVLDKLAHDLRPLEKR